MRSARIRTLGIVLGLVGLGLVRIAFLGEDESPRPVDAAPLQRERAPVPDDPTTTSSQQQRPSPSSDGGEVDLDGLPAPARAMLDADPSLADRMEQHRHAAAADARWSEAVDEAGYTADDLDPAVRQTFASADLEPRYAPDGAIDGLIVKSLPPDHPFARAGLSVGDRISRIQGVPLDDPAELPALLVRLGPRFELCTRHGSDGPERCEPIELE